MAGVKMSADEICKVIGASRAAEDGAVNGKPIAKTTLYRHFAHEMASGRAMLKTKLAAGWHRAIDEGPTRAPARVPNPQKGSPSAAGTQRILR
jgi:hypothetical protein